MLTKYGPFQGLDLKVLESEEFPHGAVEGYASVFGNVDLGGDVVVKGAFRKTLKKNLERGRIKLMDSHRMYAGTSAVVGVVKAASEKPHGLYFKAPFSSVPSAQEIRTKIKEGVLDALSFGFDILDSEPDKATGARLIKEVELYEISVVTWGMNPEAAITGVKSVLEITDDLKLAAEAHGWDQAGALERLQKQIGGDPDDWGEDEWAEYAKAHLWVDRKSPVELSSFHFPIADVVNEKVVYVFAAVKAAVDTLNAKGDNSPWIKDVDGITLQVKNLYSRFGKSLEPVGMPDGLKVLMADMQTLTDEINFQRMLSSMKEMTGSR